MAGGELPDFLFVRNECLFSSAFIFLGSDGAGLSSLFDESIESRAADLVAGDEVFDGTCRHRSPSKSVSAGRGSKVSPSISSVKNVQSPLTEV